MNEDSALLNFYGGVFSIRNNKKISKCVREDVALIFLSLNNSLVIKLSSPACACGRIRHKTTPNRLLISQPTPLSTC